MDKEESGGRPQWHCGNWIGASLELDALTRASNAYWVKSLNSWFTTGVKQAWELRCRYQWSSLQWNWACRLNQCRCCTLPTASVLLPHGSKWFGKRWINSISRLKLPHSLSRHHATGTNGSCRQSGKQGSRIRKIGKQSTDSDAISRCYSYRTYWMPGEKVSTRSILPHGETMKSGPPLSFLLNDHHVNIRHFEGALYMPSHEGGASSTGSADSSQKDTRYGNGDTTQRQTAYSNLMGR